ncbi:Uncharacterized protein dnl_18150 [Desulfonema limicola]|uniref:Uncharacterized protein n=1 Tax=Desulfonema limicola TaxID=45656 RepID=A0A975GFR7_9BACT|nr:hypothetical protein [Desulfonema limicola]QTA79542.1 Uncharacterized protein dnl_18150 [Desulfonema limicola]
MTEFKYYLYDIENPVLENSDIWKKFLPVNRFSERSEQFSITHGDYFSAIKDFLIKDRFQYLAQALPADFEYQKRKIPENIKSVNIVLEKHGEFYHPARVDVQLSNIELSFVINAAVSHNGKKCIKQEYNLLNILGKKFPFSFVPEVYAAGTGLTLTGNEIPMFLGTWFKGYCEFHISGKEKKIMVWDSSRSNPVLSLKQTQDLYRQAAMILTCYYDLETFAHIFPWHHGAGDFIVHISDKGIKLKLITVRNYEPVLLVEGDRDERAVLEALLVFFLHLSIHIRIDRLDGVGGLAWSDDLAVKAGFEGFFQGLKLQVMDSIFPENMPDIFLKYLKAFSEKDLLETAEGIFYDYPSHAPEIPFIRQNIKSHINLLGNIINSASFNM